MANESRPRSSLPSESLPTTKDNTPSIASPHETFQYTPLDLDASVPTFRVLIVHPKSSNRDDGTICCSLKHTSFGELGDIPSYEALSYMWGDESTLSHMNIEVNGHPFTVGKNLGSALARLQSMVDRTIWIDAICINQKDVVEKSSQIPNMPYIYKRCQKCVIWLGEIDPEIETSELEFHPWNEIYEPKCLDENGWGKGRILLDRDVALWKHLTSNPYWERVWIIQEIGLARKLEMMYGPYQTSFSAFTSQLKWVEGLENCIPLRLQTQRDNRYHDESHSLQYLIESHASSQCKEPRDHIYGFAGLSNDGEDFPIDYSKTHYEVWKDVVTFKIAQSATLQNDTMSFAALVKEKLGGATIPEHEVVQDSLSYSAAVLDARTQLDADRILSHTGLLSIPGQIVLISQKAGRVAHIGPTCADIISNPKTTIGWRSSINEFVESDRRPHVREESELFLRKIEAMKTIDLGLIKSYGTTLIWKDDSTRTWSSQKKKAMSKKSPPTSEPALPGFEDSKELNKHPDAGDDILDLKGQRLFLMEENKTPFHGWPSRGIPAQGSIGILPTGSREGDYICQISGIKRAIVVRREDSYNRIIGTAVMAGTLERARVIRDTNELPFQKANFDTVAEIDRLDLYIDIAKAYRLLD